MSWLQPGVSSKWQWSVRPTRRAGARLPHLCRSAPRPGALRARIGKPRQLLAGADAEKALDGLTVEFRSHGRDFFGLSQLADARFQIIVGKRQPVGFASIAGGHIRAGENVQAFELVAGIAHVAAHCRVRPGLVAVSKEAQVQLDQSGDRINRGRCRSAAPEVAFWRAWHRPNRGGRTTPPTRLEPPGCWLAMSCSSAAQRNTRSGTSSTPRSRS